MLYLVVLELNHFFIISVSSKIVTLYFFKNDGNFKYNKFPPVPKGNSKNLLSFKSAKKDAAKILAISI